MLFNSYPFLIFLLITFGLYYLPFMRRWQVHLLVVASFVFYAYSMPVLLLLLLLSIAVNTWTSYKVFFGDEMHRKRHATIGVIINLAMLAFFKYSPLVSRMFFPDTSDVGMFLLSIPLPIGISFFTFHGISLLVDIYRKKNIDQYGHLVRESFASHGLVTALYIAFFPQLVAGPIVKAYDFLPQIKTKFFREIKWEKAVKQLILGYFLKLVIADNLKDQTFWLGADAAGNPYFLQYSSPVLLTMLFGYSMQIFADFAGYSLIALGLAELFCYRLPENFNFPYISRSFSEFWTRWHISLSSWLREYLYYPLGGNRKGKARTYLNLMIVMFLGGLWHGAAWSYAIWGSFHGLALAVERFIADRTRLRESFFVKVAQTLIVFLFVTFAWLLFKLPNFVHVVKYVQSVQHNWHSGNPAIHIIFFILLYSMPVIVFHFFYLLYPYISKNFLRIVRPAIYGILLFFVMVNSGAPGDFIYFQF